MQIEHKKNTAYYLSFPMIDSTTPASFKTGVSPVDTAYYKDGAGAWTSLAIADTASEIGSTGIYEIDLTAAELNHDQVVVKFSVAGAADTAFAFDMRTELAEDLGNGSGQVSLLTATQASIDAIEADTNELQADDVPTLIATAQADLDIITGADGVNLLSATQASIDEIKVDTSTTLPSLISTANQIADAILKRDWTAITGEASRSVLNALRILRNKWATSGTTLTVTKEDDATPAWTSTLTTDGAAEPITSSDPTS